MKKEQIESRPNTRAGEPAIFLAAPAPAPDFFPKRLRLRLLVFFFERLGLQGAKNTRLRLRLLGKYSFPRKLVR